MSRLQTGGWALALALAAWLAAKALLAWLGPAPLSASPAQPAPARYPSQLLDSHWLATRQDSQVMPLTRLPLRWVGDLRSQPLSASVVVLDYQKQQRSLRQGSQLAPGIQLRSIDERGLVLDNHGQLERLPWPAQRTHTGLRAIP